MTTRIEKEHIAADESLERSDVVEGRPVHSNKTFTVGSTFSGNTDF